MENSLSRKTTKIGVVINNKAKKTVTVLVERTVVHPMYQKVIKKRKKFLAHDEYEKCKSAYFDKIIATRPLTKRKKWRVLEIVGLSPSEVEREIEGKKV